MRGTPLSLSFQRQAHSHCTGLILFLLGNRIAKYEINKNVNFCEKKNSIKIPRVERREIFRKSNTTESDIKNLHRPTVGKTIDVFGSYFGGPKESYESNTSQSNLT